jgi:formate hydrogenlyase subunit 3/multisubunit Na+/H+ antiporter MnhD subunit
MGMGLYVLLRAGAWKISTVSGQSIWLWLGTASLLGGAVLAWGEIPFGARIFYLLGSQVGYILLSLAFPAGRSASLAGLQTLNILVSGGILFLGMGYGGGSKWKRLIVALGAASLVGVPPMPGFWMRWATYQDLLEAGGTGFVVVGTVATFLLCLPVAKLRAEEESQEDKERELALALLALPLAVGAVFPELAVALMPISGLQWAGFDSWRMITRASVPALLWASCLLPLIAGYLALRGRGAWGRWLEPAMQQMARVLDVTWLLNVLAWVLAGCAQALRQMALILEGEYSLGWVLLWSMVVILLLLTM